MSAETMNIAWQDVLTVAVIVLAVGYVVRWMVRLLRRKGTPTCGGCADCGTSESPLLNLETRAEHAAQEE